MTTNDDTAKTYSLSLTIKHTWGGHRYSLFCIADVDSWEEAQSFCKAQGGHLATLTAPDENALVFSGVLLPSGFDNAYFGLTNRTTDGQWAWETGEEVSYMDWADDEPNNDGAGEYYGMYYFKFEDGRWNDGDFADGTVNGGTAFICEWE